MKKMMQVMLAAVMMMAGSYVYSGSFSLKIKEVRTKGGQGYSSTYRAWIETELEEQTKNGLFEAPENSVVKIRSGARYHKPATITTELGYESNEKTDKAKLRYKEYRHVGYSRRQKGLLNNRRNKTKQNLRSRYNKSEMKMVLRGKFRDFTNDEIKSRGDESTSTVVSLIDGVDDGWLFCPGAHPVNTSSTAPPGDQQMWKCSAYATVEITINGQLWHAHDVVFVGVGHPPTNRLFDQWNMSVTLDDSQLQPGPGFYPIAGTLRDHDGNPVAGAELTLIGAEDTSPISRNKWKTTTTNSDGSFTFGLQRSGDEYRIDGKMVGTDGDFDSTFTLDSSEYGELELTAPYVVEADDSSWTGYVYEHKCRVYYASNGRLVVSPCYSSDYPYHPEDPEQECLTALLNNTDKTPDEIRWVVLGVFGCEPFNY